MKITIEGYEDKPITIEAIEVIVFAHDAEEKYLHRIVKCSPLFMGYVAKLTESLFLANENEKTGDTLCGKIAKKLGFRD